MKKNKLDKIIIVSSFCFLMGLLITIASNNIIYATSVDSVKLVSMPLNLDFTNMGKNSDSTSLIPQLSVRKYKFGLAPSPFKLPSVIQSKIAKSVLYPTTYDLRTLAKVTSVRDQLTSGCCWAFATYSSLESNLLLAENRNFSEDNLKNNSGFDYGKNDGGNELMSTAYLARWSGPIDESDDLYNPNSIISPLGLPVQKHVQDVLWLPDRKVPTDNNTIKDSIMKYGVIYTTMNYEDPCFYTKYNSYYDSHYSNGFNNHAVSIVGWDDNYDKNKFKDSSNGAVPAGNGAFIVKNSWGTSWGDKGYFYISYYDKNVGIDNAVFNGAGPITNYKTIYQYDPLGVVTFIGNDSNESSWFSNVFIASSSDALSAVSFYTAVPSTSYQVYVCSNYNNPNDLASTRVLKATGSTSFAGYHTIKLNSGVPLTAGRKFAVIVKVTTPGIGLNIPVEAAVYGYSSDASASAG